jgi:hypothetical protein
MSTVTEDTITPPDNEPTRDDGVRVARELGWPADRIGVLGALGGLVELGAAPVRPRSTLWLLRRHRSESRSAVYRYMLLRQRRWRNGSAG